MMQFNILNKLQGPLIKRLIFYLFSAAANPS